jgi:prolyl oligopeptidase
MAGIGRRRLMKSATALSALATMRARAAKPALPAAPVAKTVTATDTYFGETVADPYRWMENPKDPDWLPYLQGQNNHTRAVLDAIPGRSNLASRIQDLSGETVLTRQVQSAGGKLFYQQRPAGADNFRLFVREKTSTRLLVDPTAMGGATGHVSLDWWKASPDGTHVVYGISPNGSEDSVLHILVVASGQDLPERIPNTQYSQPYWLDDGSGFFYTQLTGVVGSPERFLDAQSRFHRLNTPPDADPIIMKRGLDPQLGYDRIQTPTVMTFRGASHAALVLFDVRPEFRLLLAPIADILAGHARWTPVATFEDEVTDVDLHGGALYLLANKGFPLGRVLRTPAANPSLATAEIVVPASPLVIESLARAQDGLYLRMMDGGIGRLRRLGNDGQVRDIALPFDGTINDIAATPDEPGVLMDYAGWLTPADIWSVDQSGAATATGLTPKPAIDVSAYETFRGFATAHDGTQIPFTLIYRKGLAHDGRTPAWISAYGSYGIAAYTPSFAGRTLALVDAGFIVGYANVRGGGEYGRPWHKAGQLANKPNTWRDLIAVCERLCADGWTAKQRLAIGGRSAGGITMGRAMTERPDLFAAVIDGVGWSNPLRYVVEQEGFTEEPEWGAISDPAGYRALKEIDSYQHVRDGVPYPAVLLTTGVTDPRVAPFHVAKMTARLQAASSSGKPILLRVDYDAGHGIGSTRGQQDREAVDTYAFLLWQTGVAAYQPV